ncbi:MAG: hypothetical protein RSD29_02560 [Bacilli bacterium]
MKYNYRILVKLKGCEKLIKRTFLINDCVKIKDLCELIIVSMNGDLMHLYNLKHKGKYYIYNNLGKTDIGEIKMNNLSLNKILVEEKEKLELLYDFGDNWIFKILVSKKSIGHNKRNIILIDGAGKGIEEDCGGNYGLINLINNSENSCNYNIGDFNIDEINDYINKRYNDI